MQLPSLGWERELQLPLRGCSGACGREREAAVESINEIGACKNCKMANGHAPVHVTVTVSVTVTVTVNVPVFYANSIVSCCIANGWHCTRRYGSIPRPFLMPNAKFMQSANGYGSLQVLEALRQSGTGQQTDRETDRQRGR